MIPFDIPDFETIMIRDEISRCEDVEDLKEKVFPMLRTQQEHWAQKIREIIEESNLSKTEFAQACNVSRMALNKWCNGAIPKNRETFLRIGMAAGFDRDKMDQLLWRYGRYPALYSKSLEDCICIYILNNDRGVAALQKYDYILEKIKDKILRENTTSQAGIATAVFDDRLSDVKAEEELEQFVAEHSSVFTEAYHKLYAYIKMHIRANYENFDGNVFELAEGQEWSSSLRQCVSAIRQNKWYPNRNKIISLGIHLSMDHDQIDEMLELAHMEPLCAKNIFESVVMFILDDASLNNMLDGDQADYDPDELCRYAREVMTGLNLPEVTSFISELPELEDEM